jgi:hypothetical protein
VVYEMQVEHLILRLEGRVFEVLSDQTDAGQRIHVSVAGFAVKGPDRKGNYKVQIGMLHKGEINKAAGWNQVELDEAGFARFSQLVKIVHAARDAGPDPW